MSEVKRLQQAVFMCKIERRRNRLKVMIFRGKFLGKITVMIQKDSEKWLVSRKVVLLTRSEQ